MNDPRYTRAKSFTKIYHSEVKVERFVASIIVYPMVFERGYFLMGGETYTEEGPWAKSLIEALEYILLHELGHYESYVTTYAKTIRDLKKMENSERMCDQFASSILRCYDSHENLSLNLEKTKRSAEDAEAKLSQKRNDRDTLRVTLQQRRAILQNALDEKAAIIERLKKSSKNK
jgi:hypothetical protein